MRIHAQAQKTARSVKDAKPSANCLRTDSAMPPPSHTTASLTVKTTYALTVLRFMPFLLFFSRSFSRNLRCSSALRRPSLASRCSFLSLSAASLRSSAFSSSSRRRILEICSSRVCRMRRSASGRKWAAEVRWSGSRRNWVKMGSVLV